MQDQDRNEQISNEIKTTTRTNLFQRLAARFGFGVTQKDSQKNKANQDFVLIKKPTADQLLSKNIKDETDLIHRLFKDGKLSSTIQDLFDDWINDTQNTYANIQDREERINALLHMCDNEGLVKNSVQLVASEVAALTDNVAFTVTSEDEEWQDETNETIKNVWKYDAPTVYSLAWDIFLFGEAFQGREVSSAGVVGLNTLKANEIIERIEFKPAQVMNFNAQLTVGGGKSSGFSANITNPTQGSFASNNLSFSPHKATVYRSTDSLLRDYIQNISDICADEYFTSHLLGYRIANDTMVAPWQVVHYRFNEHVSEFWPYGQPPLLACLAAYKQLQRAMGIDDLKQLMSMPIYMYKVKTNGATTARAFDIVNTVKEEFENVGLIASAAGMEGPSLCTNIWTSDDLVTIEKVAGDSVNEGAGVDKLDFFYKRLAQCTGIPMNYLDPSAEGFQMSGVALATLFQPFRTLVEQIRNIIATEVEDNIRLHDSIRNRKTPPFVLTMNVINPVATDDLSNRLQLADTVLDTITSLLGLEDKTQLPQSIKADILAKYACLSTTELKGYMNVLDQEGAEEASPISQDEMDSSFGDRDNTEYDEGPDEETSLEESKQHQLFRRKKQRLIEARYRAAKPEDIKMFLTEKLGTLRLPRSISRVSTTYSSKFNAEVGSFLVENRKTKKRGKRKLKG